jgi:hypothetical protein
MSIEYLYIYVIGKKDNIKQVHSIAREFSMTFKQRKGKD